jgi:hypothetical protein
MQWRYKPEPTVGNLQPTETALSYGLAYLDLEPILTATSLAQSMIAIKQKIPIRYHLW